MAKVVIKVGVATLITTGIDFRYFANRYFDAADALRGQPSIEWFDPIPYHLLCQSLELHLKAYIWLTDHLSRDRIKRKYGHDIVKLWRHAKRRNISRYCTITPRRDRTIQLVGPLYKERKFVYLDLLTWRKEIPQLRKNTQVLPTLSRLCEQLDRSLEQPILTASNVPGEP